MTDDDSGESHSGGVNTWSLIRFCSDRKPFTDGRRGQRLPLTSGIKKWIQLQCYLSTWLQLWSTEVTSIVVCLCSVMLTAAGEIWFTSWTLQSPSILRQLLIQNRVVGAAASAASPRLPFPQPHRLTLPGESPGAPRPEKRSNPSTWSWVYP